MTHGVWHLGSCEVKTYGTAREGRPLDQILQKLEFMSTGLLKRYWLSPYLRLRGALSNLPNICIIHLCKYQLR